MDSSFVDLLNLHSPSLFFMVCSSVLAVILLLDYIIISLIHAPVGQYVGSIALIKNIWYSYGYRGKNLRLYTFGVMRPSGLLDWHLNWVKLPSTFDTLAKEYERKLWILSDIDLFMSRRRYYEEVGRSWKRGYLLYGPSGTGKTTLISAIANYLKFNIYVLDLTILRDNRDLRRAVARIRDSSILVIEDVDSYCHLRNGAAVHTCDHRVTLSGLLNSLDGLWSWGYKRPLITIFTAKDKGKIHPQLLRHGRMDIHIHMSYLTSGGFRVLAGKHLDRYEHWSFLEIDELLRIKNVTAAEAVEELMKKDDADSSLEGFVRFLRNKEDNHALDRSKICLK